MAIKTQFRDDIEKGVREAWQKARVAYTWTAREIERMHSEASDTVPEFGKFKNCKPFGFFMRKR
jgi:hypothetical protein